MGDTKEVRKDLLKLQEELRREKSRLEMLRSTPLCKDDLAQDACTQNVAVQAVKNKTEMLQKIAATIGRIDNGTFGICTRCHEDIAPRRLEFVPYEAFCFSCQQRQESKGRDSAQSIPAGLTQPAFW